jgi:hypothetical protein
VSARKIATAFSSLGDHVIDRHGLASLDGGPIISDRLPADRIDPAPAGQPGRQTSGADQCNCDDEQKRERHGGDEGEVAAAIGQIKTAAKKMKPRLSQSAACNKAK